MYGRYVNGEWVWGMPPIVCEDVWEILEYWEEDLDDDR